MKIKFEAYRTAIFDCDGVILDSNKIKTKAFYECTRPYGNDFAESLVNYHTQNGGISRYEKFKYFLESILGTLVEESTLEQLLSKYSTHVKQELLKCEIAAGLFHLREVLSDQHWLVASGGDQDELREIFRIRNLFELFNGGIFGSPDPKDKIVDRELKVGNIKGPTVFLGDSRYDYEIANRYDFDFIFISKYSEFRGWRDFFKDKKDVTVVDELTSLLVLNK